LNCIKSAGLSHLLHTKAHYESFTNRMAPELKKRVKYPDHLDEEHETLKEKLHEVEKLVKGLSEGGEVNPLIKMWGEYEEVMLPHLEKEDEEGVSLMRAYFTKKDIEVVTQRIIALSPPNEMGSIIYYIGVDKFRNQVMPQEGIPSFSYFVDFVHKFRTFVKEFRKPVDALTSGEEPPKQKCIIV